MRRASDVVGRLYVLYHEVNDRHFMGLLPAVAIELRRVRGGRATGRFIAETVHDARDRPRLIVIDERFARSAPWDKVRRTLIHEIVHVWQGAMGYTDTHGESFKRGARRLGISPSWTVD